MCVSKPNPTVLSRRAAMFGLPLFLTGCMSAGQVMETVEVPAGPDPYYLAMYGPQPGERFPLPATDISRVEERFLRQQVNYHRSETAGTIVVDTQNRFLYLVQENGKAMRYGIGVGQAGLEFSGTARVGRKAEWPRWTPTQSMIERDPERNAQWPRGMEPGLTNPLGPRALYLFEGNRDTLYRIHGTSEPWSIGLAVSSGCVRLFNQDIIDLYNRVPLDTVVVVLQNEPLMYPQRELPDAIARQLRPAQPQPQQVPEYEMSPAFTSEAEMSTTIDQIDTGTIRRPAIDI